MSTLPTATLGKTGLQVTRLGYGAMEIRGSRIWSGREVSDTQAQTILNAVLDSGINFIDTSNCYGKSEEYIGKFISHRRDEYVLATKTGCTIKYKNETTDETPHVFTRENMLRTIEESLTRMKTDYVDILQLHNPDIETCQREGVVDVLKDIQAQGKTRFISISTRFPELPTCLDWDIFDTFQIPYSALERTHEDAITASAGAGLGIIVRGGVARGEPGVGLAAVDKWEDFKNAKLDELLEPGQTPTAFMLRFTLSHPHAHTIIAGTLNPDHLAENVKTVQQGPLPADVYEEAKKRLTAIGQSPQPMP